MADPITVIGGIDACQSLAGILYNIVSKSISFGKDVKALERRFEDDRIVLNNYRGFFDDHQNDLKQEYLGHFNITTLGLRTDLEAVGKSVKRYKKKLLPDRLTWFFVEGDVTQAEAGLRDWCERMQTHFLQLPYELREKMADRVTSSEYQANHKALSGLLASLHLLKQKELAESTTDEEALLGLKAIEPPDNVNHTNGAAWRPYKKHTVAIPFEVHDNPTRKREMELEVARLVKMLGADKPVDADADHLHIPRAVSYFERPAPADRLTNFGIVYEMPKNAQDIFTLRDVIREPSNHSLDDRIKTARAIATAIAYVHSIDWVHKGIRPDNILLIYRPGDVKKPRGLGQAYLTGFEYARRSDKYLISTGSDAAEWDEQIYRHPERQVDRPSSFVYFKPYHDLYSLGVVLLELGLWYSFDILEVKKVLQHANADSRRQFMLAKADKLDNSVGRRYQNVVRKCLNMDKDSPVDIHEILGDLERIQLS